MRTIKAKSWHKLIAERFLDFRHDLGLTQRELARRLGVSNATIALTETGKTRPSAGLLVSLLVYSGRTLEDFLD